MKNLIFSLAIIFCFEHLLSAQKDSIISCRIGDDIIQAQIRNGFGLMFSTVHTQNQQVDTLLVSQLGDSPVECECSDSIATFYTRDPLHSRLIIFYRNKDKWMFQYNQPLPPEIPPVGILIPGEKYASYSYRLLKPDVLIANKEVFSGDRSEREKFEIRFKIDTANNRLITESETKLKE